MLHDRVYPPKIIVPLLTLCRSSKRSLLAINSLFRIFTHKLGFYTFTFNSLSCLIQLNFHQAATLGLPASSRLMKVSRLIEVRHKLVVIFRRNITLS